MRLRSLTAGLGAALLVLAGCADETDTTADTTTTTTETTAPAPVDDAALERIADAAERTIAEGTARMEITVYSDGLDAVADSGAGTGDVTTTTTTAGDDATTTVAGGEVTTTTADGQATTDPTTGTGARGDVLLRAEGAVDFEQELRRITFQLDQGTFEVIIDGNEAYVEVPGTEDETWARIDLDTIMDGDFGFGGPGGIPFQDPQANLDALRGSVRDVREVGQEQVRGEQTTHYQLTVDLRAAADQANEDTRQATDSLHQWTQIDELDMHVWVGEDDDLIHRIGYELDLGDARVDTGAATTTTEVGGDVTTTTAGDDATTVDPQGRLGLVIEFFDFGQDVDIQVPDDAQVIDLDEDQIRNAFGGGSGTATTTTTGTGVATTTTVG